MITRLLTRLPAGGRLGRLVGVGGFVFVLLPDFVAEVIRSFRGTPPEGLGWSGGGVLRIGVECQLEAETNAVTSSRAP
jgi:hypothetical protein